MHARWTLVARAIVASAILTAPALGRADFEGEQRELRLMSEALGSRIAGCGERPGDWMEIRLEAGVSVAAMRITTHRFDPSCVRRTMRETVSPDSIPQPTTVRFELGSDGHVVGRMVRPHGDRGVRDGLLVTAPILAGLSGLFAALMQVGGASASSYERLALGLCAAGLFVTSLALLIGAMVVEIDLGAGDRAFEEAHGAPLRLSLLPGPGELGLTLSLTL